MKSIDRLTFIAAGVLLLIFGLVIFHAPLSVYISQFAPEAIIKAWKEILLLLVTPLILYLLAKKGYLRQLSNDVLLQLVVIYCLLHLVLAISITTSPYQTFAGLLIDLRYLLFFVLVLGIVMLQPSLRKVFVKVGAIASAISLGFAALQATLLPHDILKYIGYSKDTIQPYLTVDKNHDFIRINGTFRGPNPLGAYTVIVLSAISALFLKKRKAFEQYKWQLLILTLLAVIALWASYSRSALLALVISIVTLVIVSVARKIQIRYWFAFAIIIVVLLGSLFNIRDSSFVQNVVLHNNPNGGSSLDSNEQHATSLSQGLEQTVRHPYGVGIGSTGSASLKSNNPNIIENQYIFIAHEAGWLGLGLFLVIFEIIMWRLYQNRRDWLSLGVFASGIGLACIGLLLPVWADDTISLIWFGLAAVAIGSHYKIKATK